VRSLIDPLVNDFRFDAVLAACNSVPGVVARRLSTDDLTRQTWITALNDDARLTLSRRPSAGEYMEEASGLARQAADAGGRVGPSRGGALDLGCMAALRTGPILSAFPVPFAMLRDGA
jgi:hypothetical protein